MQIGSDAHVFLHLLKQKLQMYTLAYIYKKIYRLLFISKNKVDTLRVQVSYQTRFLAFTPTTYVSADIFCLQERKEKLPKKIICGNLICCKGLFYLRFDKSKGQLLFKY